MFLEIENYDNKLAEKGLKAVIITHLLEYIDKDEFFIVINFNFNNNIIIIRYLIIITILLLKYFGLIKKEKIFINLIIVPN